MPSGPKKRRAERKKNVLQQVKIEEGLDVKREHVPVEVHEPVAVKIEPFHDEVYAPAVEPPGVGPAVVGLVEPIAGGLVEPVVESSVPEVGLVEPVVDSSVPEFGVVEPVSESSVPVVGLVEPVVESPEIGLVELVAEPSMVVLGLAEPVVESLEVDLVESVVESPEVCLVESVVESSVTVAYSTDSCQGIVVVDDGDELPQKESGYQVNGKIVDQVSPPLVEIVVHSIDGEELSSVDELANSDNLVQKCSFNGGAKVTTKVELEEVKKTIEEQLRVVDKVTANLRQILASLN